MGVCDEPDFNLTWGPYIGYVFAILRVSATLSDIYLKI
jgi:hypothetical protein